MLEIVVVTTTLLFLGLMLGTLISACKRLSANATAAYIGLDTPEDYIEN